MVTTIVYRVEAGVREGRKKPVKRTAAGEGLTLPQAEAKAKTLFTELTTLYPHWTTGETAIVYNQFFTLA